jgi:hypothetical protein
MSTSKTSARRSGSRKSKSDARQPIKSKWPRHSHLQFDMRVKVPSENPYRDGTERHEIYEALKRAKTVGAFMDPERNHVKGKALGKWHMRRRMLRNLVHEGVAKVA